jgi:TfoX/Sxy family transcriptional regulator of competence genes
MPDDTTDPELEILSEIAGDYEADEAVELRTMFRRPGLRVNGKIFAFLGFGRRLIVKVPRPRAQELVGAGEAETVTMGERTMKEWVAVPMDGDRRTTTETWRRAAREAHEYVRSLA